jgi:ABC-type Fe3+-siderophore transport system permease subunit
LLKSREWTQKTKHQASLDFDKAVMTLAGGGAIGVTVAFLDKVAKSPIKQPGLLGIAWVALTLSLLTILVSYLTSIKAHEKVMETTDAVLRGDSKSESPDIQVGGSGWTSRAESTLAKAFRRKNLRQNPWNLG